jgi:hypothetical protein
MENSKRSKKIERQTSLHLDEVISRVVEGKLYQLQEDINEIKNLLRSN